MTSASVPTSDPCPDAQNARLIRYLGPHFRVRLGLASNAFPDELLDLARAARDARRHQDSVLEAVKRKRDSRCERGGEEVENRVTAVDILAAVEDIERDTRFRTGKGKSAWSEREVSDDEAEEVVRPMQYGDGKEQGRSSRKRTHRERDYDGFADEERSARYTSPRGDGRVGQPPGRCATTVYPQTNPSAYHVSTSHLGALSPASRPPVGRPVSNLSAMDRLVISSFESMSAGAALALEEGHVMTLKIGRKRNGRYYFTHQIQEDNDSVHDTNAPIQAHPGLAPFYPQPRSMGFGGGAVWTGQRTPQYPQRWGTLPSVAPPPVQEGW